MPKTAEHAAQSRKNLRFAESFDLDKTENLDWVVTAYFYAALHLVDAVLFFRDHIDPPNREMLMHARALHTNVHPKTRKRQRKH